jgi:hypothetical protein
METVDVDRVFFHKEGDGSRGNGDGPKQKKLPHLGTQRDRQGHNGRGSSTQDGRVPRFHHGQRHAKGNAREEQKPKIKTKGAEREVQGDAAVTQKDE